MLCEPFLTTRSEAGWDIPLLVWQAERPLLAVGSAPLGGGIGVRGWVLNATVPMSYHRDDPAAHLAELADGLGLGGPGVGLLTGVDVTEVVSRADGGVRVWATVGLGTPVWAAAPEPAPPAAPEPAPPAQRVGTVNIVVYVPQRLGDAALVNAVATATEAKAQAIWELGLPATGTPTDAVTVLCPADGEPAPYGGPRSAWGAPLARAVHAAVRSGGAGTVVPWSDRVGG
ncbi:MULTISPECIES: adenosylcobinamide amidohydrolase [unclassified Micromonospora]|uniref:adenosylcobinamide amidohydrolase n=1 Tax=unclassified Micromonospora TaxID=2617518 RepID=UPI001B38864B|nr:MULTISPECIES: adenosylcobinamide amidohydrolase [unclassified Micromonospora]MBQ1042868.1 adenosylcobinamide amidohydrolase [Micromonospora sp. C72]MBQ1057941.1 adenosylcobinamide amidohydrolase [Micromonospora sp. C32]